MNEIVNVSILFSVLLLIGYLLSRQLYLKKHPSFRKSSLETKVLLWVPIFIIFIAFLSGNMAVQIAIITWVLLNIVLDSKDRYTKAKHKVLLIVIALFTSFGMCTAIPLYYYSSTLLLAVVFASVVSDVFAFFIGNYIGHHKLPKRINPNKSWEGVIGQCVGAFIGILLLNIFVTDIAYAWAIIVAFGTALGDICNSYVKRSEGFKDWSNRLPGHGGYIDRFSSLSFAILLSTLSVNVF